MRYFARSLVLFLFTSLAHAQSRCPPGDAARAALLPLGLQYKLLAHKIPADDFELDARADVSRDMVMLRKTLDVATQAFFHCEAGKDSSPASLEGNLAGFLHADQSKRDNNHDKTDGIYGANLTVHIEPAKGLPNSLFVVLTFDVDCGEDNLLFLYTKEDGWWQQRLHWYGDKYTKPSDAFGDFFVYAPAPGPDHQTFVAVAHGMPWCTSRYSGFKLDLIQPATPNSQQKLIASTSNDYSRGDTSPTLKPYTEGVTLRLDSSSRDLEGVFTYVGVFRYRTVGGTLERLPVAGNARDFVDSWLDERWPVAAKWSAQPDSKLEAVHQRFRYDSHAEKDVPDIHYGPVRACSANADHLQVEIDLTHLVQTQQKKLPPIYAQVRQNQGSFTMLAITANPDLTCTGPDIMKKR